MSEELEEEQDEEQKHTITTVTREKSYNILDKPCITVLDHNYKVHHISLSEHMQNFDKYERLAFQNTTQNVAVMRIESALLSTVFYRYQADGTEYLIYTKDEAEKRWIEYFQNNKIPAKPLEKYFEKWHDRFDLFDKEHPFLQVPLMVDGTAFPNTKFNPSVNYRKNKMNQFSLVDDEYNDLMPDENIFGNLANRFYFDDSASKTFQGKNPKLGWLGQCGLIYFDDNNYFYTLMFNTPPLKDGSELWGEPKPVWEQGMEKIPLGQVAIPDNWAEIATMPSRDLILLTDEDDNITGYRAKEHSYFDPAFAFGEQWTLWKKVTNKQTKETNIIPRTHDKGMNVWREMEAILPLKDGQIRIPGIIKSFEMLQDRELIPEDFNCNLGFCSVSYDPAFKGYVKDEFSSVLTLSSKIFAESNEIVREMIIHMVDKIEKLTTQVKILKHGIGLALGYDSEKLKRDSLFVTTTEEMYLDEINFIFKRWLNSLNGEMDDEEMAEKQKELENAIIPYTRNFGQSIATEAGPSAFIGRKVQDKNKKNVYRRYCSPELLNIFQVNVSKIWKEERPLTPI